MFVARGIIWIALRRSDMFLRLLRSRNVARARATNIPLLAELEESGVEMLQTFRL